VDANVHLQDVSVFNEDTSVGLDVHMRSIVECAIELIMGRG
jgi:hypothetical protein